MKTIIIIGIVIVSALIYWYLIRPIFTVLRHRTKEILRKQTINSIKLTIKEWGIDKEELYNE